MKLNSNKFLISLSFFTIITSALLWLARIFVIKQYYLSKNAKLSSYKSTIRMLLFCFQSGILYFPSTKIIELIFITVSLALVTMSFIISLIIIENIDEQLEYFHYLKSSFSILFYLSLLVGYLLPNLNFLLFFSLLLFIFVQHIGVLKTFFEIKYNYLLDRVAGRQNDQDLVILLEIVGVSNKSNELRGRAKHLETEKHIQFKFHQRAKNICA